MLEVAVRIDMMTEVARSIRMDGFAIYPPVVGEVFNFLVFKHGHCIEVSLGQVFNMNCYGDILLIQTDLTVAEVQIKSGGESSGYLNNLKTVKPTLRLVKGELC